MMLNINDSQSITNFISELYLDTDENGYLMIPAFYRDGKNTQNLYYSCEMNWNKNDAENFKTFALDFFEMFKGILNKYLKEKKNNSIKDLKKYVAEFLDEDELKFWNVYLKSFKTSVDLGEMDEDSINSKTFFGEELSSKELEAYNKYCNEVITESKERLGDNEFSYDVIIRSERLFRVLELNAPDIVSSSYIKEVVEALLLYKHAISVTEVIGVR